MLEGNKICNIIKEVLSNGVLILPTIGYVYAYEEHSFEIHIPIFCWTWNHSCPCERFKARYHLWPQKNITRTIGLHLVYSGHAHPYYIPMDCSPGCQLCWECSSSPLAQCKQSIGCKLRFMAYFAVPSCGVCTSAMYKSGSPENPIINCQLTLCLDGYLFKNGWFLSFSQGFDFVLALPILGLYEFHEILLSKWGS